jgi:hypothetical protein
VSRYRFESEKCPEARFVTEQTLGCPITVKDGFKRVGMMTKTRRNGSVEVIFSNFTILPGVRNEMA